jgi:hypothetical protein
MGQDQGTWPYSPASPTKAGRASVVLDDWPKRKLKDPGLPPRSTPPPATRSATGCRGPATGRSTRCCTLWPPSNYAIRRSDGPNTTAAKPTARPPWKPYGRSSAGCRTSSIGPWSTTPSARPPPTESQARGRAREDTRGRLQAPARSTRTPASTLRRSHFPDPPPDSLRRCWRPPLEQRSQSRATSVRALASCGPDRPSWRVVADRVALVCGFNRRERGGGRGPRRLRRRLGRCRRGSRWSGPSPRSDPGRRRGLWRGSCASRRGVGAA